MSAAKDYLKSKTVLVVEDDEDLRDIVAYDFKREGFTTLTAENGTEAFDIISKNKIDIVISDVQMPNGNGVQLLDRVRDLNVELPVLMFITGFTDLSVEQAYEKGANGMFAKPFDRKELMRSVHHALLSRDERWKPTAERVPVDFKVEIKSDANAKWQIGRAVDIGQGGLFVRFDGSLPGAGDRVEFSVTVRESGVQITGLAIARWARQERKGEADRGFGLEFISLPDEARSEIIRIIDTKKPKPFIPAK